MATKADLQDAVTALEGATTDVNNQVEALSTEQAAAFKRLEDKIAAGGGTAEDLQAEVDRVNTVTGALQGVKTVVEDALTKAQAEGN